MNELSREDQILLITEMIADIWGRYPELRLGQLIDNGVSTIEGDVDVFYVTDIDLITALEYFDETQMERTDGPEITD